MIDKDYFESDGSTINKYANEFNAYWVVSEILGSDCTFGLEKFHKVGILAHENKDKTVRIFFNIYAFELDLPSDYTFDLVGKQIE